MHIEERKCLIMKKIGKGPNMLENGVFGLENRVVVKLSLEYPMCLMGEAYLTFSESFSY